METKKLTKKRLRKLMDKASSGPGAHIRCKVVACADDAFSQDRLDRLGDKLADYVRLEIRNTLHHEYMGVGFEVSKRCGIMDAIEILGCKTEYYEEDMEEKNEV